jgi:hypothetical protein
MNENMVENSYELATTRPLKAGRAFIPRLSTVFDASLYVMASIPPHLIKRCFRLPTALQPLQDFTPGSVPALHLPRHLVVPRRVDLLQHGGALQGAFPQIVGPAQHGIELPLK